MFNKKFPDIDKSTFETFVFAYFYEQLHHREFLSFKSLHIGLKGFVVMPFLCYYLQVHDCVISIMGSISGIENQLVFAFATQGWHMYFGLALSGLRSVERTDRLTSSQIKYLISVATRDLQPYQSCLNVFPRPTWVKYFPSPRQSPQL